MPSLTTVQSWCDSLQSGNSTQWKRPTGLKGESLEAVHSPAQALLISLVNGLILKLCHPGLEDGRVGGAPLKHRQAPQCAGVGSPDLRGSWWLQLSPLDWGGLGCRGSGTGRSLASSRFMFTPPYHGGVCGGGALGYPLGTAPGGNTGLARPPSTPGLKSGLWVLGRSSGPGRGSREVAGAEWEDTRRAASGSGADVSLRPQSQAGPVGWELTPGPGCSRRSLAGPAAGYR